MTLPRADLLSWCSSLDDSSCSWGICVKRSLLELADLALPHVAVGSFQQVFDHVVRDEEPVGDVFWLLKMSRWVVMMLLMKGMSGSGGFQPVVDERLY